LESWFRQVDRNIVVSDEQLGKLIDACSTIPEFFGSPCSRTSFYTEEVLAGLRESDDDLANNQWNQVRTFDASPLHRSARSEMFIET
jgi:hypothetical protein